MAWNCCARTDRLTSFPSGLCKNSPHPPAPPPLCGGVTSHRTLRQSEDKGRKVPNMWHVACGMWEREGAIQRCGTRHKKRWSGSGLTAQRDPATQRPSALQYRRWRQHAWRGDTETGWDGLGRAGTSWMDQMNGIFLRSLIAGASTG